MTDFVLSCGRESGPHTPVDECCSEVAGRPRPALTSVPSSGTKVLR
jgi:hypothetical protein